MHLALDDIPALDDDPFSEEVIANPRPFQTKLRDAGPVAWLSQYGFYAVGGYDDVASVLGDWKQYSSARGVGTTDFAKEEPWWGERAVLIESDPPRHNEIKAKVMGIYNPRALGDMGVMFRREAESLLDGVLVQGTCDAQADIAAAYPLKAFGDALGIDSKDRETLLTFGDLVFSSFGPMNSIRKKALAEAEKVGAMDYMRTRTARDAVQAGSLGQQLHDLSGQGDLTPAESANVMRGQLSAGVDKTVAAIGYAIYCLARNPDQYQMLRDDPNLAVKAFEEAVRLLSPLQTILRTTTGEAELGGVPIRPDYKIIISIAAANRDARKFENPETYDLTRNFTGHVGFGRGVHTCVGMHVAKLEAEHLLQAFAERVKSLSVIGEPSFKLNNTVRSMTKLPISVELA